METKSLIKKLNWFYSLEVTQVDNYLAQSKAVDDPYIANGLERVALIEQGHVENLSLIIINLGAKPTILGDIISPLLGTVLGKILGITEITSMLKANINLEARAVTDYQNLINELKIVDYDQGLIKTLEYNLIDEDLHTSWFAQVISRKGNHSWPLSPELAKEAKNDQ